MSGKLPYKSKQILKASEQELKDLYDEIKTEVAEDGIDLDQIVQSCSNEIDLTNGGVFPSDINVNQAKLSELLRNTSGYAYSFVDGFSSKDKNYEAIGSRPASIGYVPSLKSPEYQNSLFVKSYNEAKLYNLLIKLQNTDDSLLTTDEQLIKIKLFTETDMGNEFIDKFNTHIQKIVSVLDKENVLNNIVNYLKKEGITQENIFEAIEKFQGISLYNGLYKNGFENTSVHNLLTRNQQDSLFSNISNGLLQDLEERLLKDDSFYPSVVGNAFGRIYDYVGFYSDLEALPDDKRKKAIEANRMVKIGDFEEQKSTLEYVFDFFEEGKIGVNERNIELTSKLSQANSDMKEIIKSLKKSLRDGILEKDEVESLLKLDQGLSDVMITHIECQLKDGTIKNLTPKEVKEQQENIGEFKRLFVWNEGKNGTKAQTLAL
ncbi:MAG: hypothetical protein SFT90_03190 [Rickettsiales bacterium]|nr:hypothetical protein [Rickettsiales bacterium]